MSYKVVLTGRFLKRLKEESGWLYDHWERDYGTERADEKLAELKGEVQNVLDSLIENPDRPPAINEDDKATRGKSVHDKRYKVVWVIDEKNQTVSVTDFEDLKYPQGRRYQDIQFDEE